MKSRAVNTFEQDNFNKSSGGNASDELMNTPRMQDRAKEQQSIFDITMEGGSRDSKLPEPLKVGIEKLSGEDMSSVKVYYNSPRPREIDAHAYAQGNEIYLDVGQEEHLPHEAWHVVQQKQGKVSSDAIIDGKEVNTEETLENEADIMGAKALEIGLKEVENSKETKS